MIEDKQIVNKILDGQTEDFEILVDRYYEAILRYTKRILNFHLQDAEDVTSQTFLNCYKHLAGYNPRLKFSSWLYRIAHNESVNLIRKKSKYYVIDPTTIEITADPKDSVYNSDDLHKVLNQLNLKDRNILTLFYLQELSLKEISEVLKISLSAVKVRLKRARDKAKQIADITFPNNF